MPHLPLGFAPPCCLAPLKPSSLGPPTPPPRVQPAQLLLEEPSGVPSSRTQAPPPCEREHLFEALELSGLTVLSKGFLPISWNLQGTQPVSSPLLV